MLKNPKSLIDQEYLAKLKDLIETMELEQDKQTIDDQMLKEMYPKSYLYKKVTQMLQKKEGQTEFEILTGVNEFFGEESTQKKMDQKMQMMEELNQPRRYNIDEL